MRSQASQAKNRAEIDATVATERAQVVQLLRRGVKVAEITRLTAVKRTTADRLKACLVASNEVGLKKLLNRAANRAGRRPVIGHEENRLIKDRIRFAAEHGFSWNNNLIRHVMGK